MTLAMSEAGLPPEAIEYVAYHGTGTELNDRVETRAVRLAFGAAAGRLPGSSIKSMIGHPQGACGAAGVAATLLGMRDGFLPPTINLDRPDPLCDLDYVAERGARRVVRARPLQLHRVRLEEQRARREPRRLVTFLVPPRRPATRCSTTKTSPPEEMARSLRDLDLVQRAWGSRARARPLARPAHRPGRAARRASTWARAPPRSRGSSRAASRRQVVRRRRSPSISSGGTSRRDGRSRARHLPCAAADAFSLPFSDGGVDWTVSTLLFHHFSPAENRDFLRELSRVSRKGFLVLDLRRHRIPWAVVSLAGRVLFESRVSLLDGRASVLQAYTPEEADAIAADAVPGARAQSVFPTGS